MSKGRVFSRKHNPETQILIEAESTHFASNDHANGTSDGRLSRSTPGSDLLNFFGLNKRKPLPHPETRDVLAHQGKVRIRILLQKGRLFIQTDAGHDRLRNSVASLSPPKSCKENP
jgi:hypothetical protein